MENIAKLLEGISSIIWPAIIAIILWYLRKPIKDVAKSWIHRKSTLKIGDFEVSVDEYNQQSLDLIADLQTKILDLEKRIGDTDLIKNNDSENISKKINNILWVDDYPQNHLLVIELLRDRNLSIIQVKSTEKALFLLEKKHFDLVITDLHRKENGKGNQNAGFELTAKIREFNSEILTVMYFGKSKKTANRIRKKAEDIGINYVLSSPTELIDLIEQYH